MDAFDDIKDDNDDYFRYLMNGVSWWGHKVDNAYWLWNFQGKILKQSCVDKFCQLCWRPRSVLSRNNCSKLVGILTEISENVLIFLYQILNPH